MVRRDGSVKPTLVDGPDPRELTREEARELVDRRARRLLGMSLEEFEARLERGELDLEDDRVARVVFLLPLVR